MLCIIEAIKNHEYNCHKISFRRLQNVVSPWQDQRRFASWTDLEPSQPPLAFLKLRGVAGAGAGGAGCARRRNGCHYDGGCNHHQWLLLLQISIRSWTMLHWSHATWLMWYWFGNQSAAFQIGLLEEDETTLWSAIQNKHANLTYSPFQIIHLTYQTAAPQLLCMKYPHINNARVKENYQGRCVSHGQLNSFGIARTFAWNW